MIKSREEQEANPTWNMLTPLIAAGISGRLPNRPSLVLVKSRFKFGTIGAEIGVWEGGLTQIILEDMKPKKIYLVDPWMLYPDFIEELKGAGFVGGRYEKYFDQKLYDDMYTRVINKFSGNKTVEVMRGMSEDMANRIPNFHLDWAYIDGSHKEKYVYKDLVAWWPKIKIGGILCGHDFTFPGIPPALERFSNGMSLVVWPYGGDWWIIK
jgi:hypothetical protein